MAMNVLRFCPDIARISRHARNMQKMGEARECQLYGRSKMLAARQIDFVKLSFDLSCEREIRFHTPASHRDLASR
jgi:hypothetical protein